MTQQTCNADVTVTKALVRACIQEQFPGLTPIVDVVYLDSGWDNTVFLVNNHFIFRFPRHKHAVDLLEAENIILKKIHKNFDLQIPYPEYIGKSTAKFPYPFHGYKKIEGNLGCYVNLSEQERVVSIVPLAHFLKKLHSIKAPVVRGWGVGRPAFDRTNVQLNISALQKYIEKIKQQNIIQVDTEFVEHEINLIKNIKLPLHSNCLVHGDLYCKHVLFDEKHKLTGIIDWGDTGISHPVADLGIIHGFYPKSSHKIFFDLYGIVDEEIWGYARFLAIKHAYILIWYAHEVGDAMLHNEMYKSLQRLKK